MHAFSIVDVSVEREMAGRFWTIKILWPMLRYYPSIRIGKNAENDKNVSLHAGPGSKPGPPNAKHEC
jgi:hypothetical protein